MGHQRKRDPGEWQQYNSERRLWALSGALRQGPGLDTVAPGLEDVHRFVEQAACQYAASRISGKWADRQQALAAIDQARTVLAAAEIDHEELARWLAGDDPRTYVAAIDDSLARLVREERGEATEQGDG